MNHFTNDFTKILMTPITDIEYYLPKFSKFQDKIFRDDIGENSPISITKVTDICLNFKNENRNELAKDKKEKDNMIINPVYELNKEYFFYLKEKETEENIINNNYNPEDFDIFTKFIYNKHLYKRGKSLQCGACLVKLPFHIRGIIYINYKEIGFYSYETKKTEKDEDYDIDKKTCFGSVFKEKSDKLEGVGPAPLADKKINKEEEDNNNYLNTNKNLFVNTYTNGFYSRMKLKENINDITKKRQNNEKSNDMKINRRKIEINDKSESNSEESKEEDDINTNLNINEIQNKKNKERNIRNNNATSYNFYSIDNNNKNRIVQNKYLITTNNREMNTTFNKKNIGNNYNLTYSVEPSIKNKISINTNNKEKSSPIKYGLNNNADYTGLKKYVKIKGINSNLSQERNNYFYNMNNNNESNSNNSCTDIKYSYNTIKKYEKQPYFKKLINNDSTINSINRTGISSYYLTNTDLNKKLDNNYRNTVNATNINTYNRIKTNNYRNRNIENDSYINEKIDNLNDININKKEQQSISTTSSRFRKMFYRIKREENTNVNDISTEVKNAKDFIIQENDKKNKREIESYTQFNWNKNSNIFIRKNKISNLNDNNINNINSFEDKKNLTTRNFYKKNNISHNNDINRITVNTSHNKNNITVNKIEVNTLENKSSQKVYQSIRKKYLNIKNNKINNNNNIINNSMEVDNN